MLYTRGRIRLIALCLLASSFGALSGVGLVGPASACSWVEPLTMQQVAEVLRHGDSSVLDDWPFIPSSIVGVFDRKVVRVWPSDGVFEDASGAVTTEYWGEPPPFDIAVFGGATIYSPPTTSSCGPTPPVPPVGAVSYAAELSTGGSVAIAVDALTADDRALLADVLGGPHAAPVVDVPEGFPYDGTTQSATTSSTSTLPGPGDTEPQALTEPASDDDDSVPVLLIVSGVAAVIIVVVGVVARMRRSPDGT